MSKRLKKIFLSTFLPIFILLIGIFIFFIVKSNVRKELALTFDADYYWTCKTYDDSLWFYEAVPAGFEYYLYIPPEYRNDRHNEEAKLPLIVTFHGSGDKYSSRGKFGRMLIAPEIQNVKKCAVLCLHARGDYFTNCYDVSLMIQNILMRNECIDKKCIIGFGHSQGAEFVVKLSCYEPALFKAVISGSGYYKPTLRELIKILPVRYWWKISKYDKGIYEQGYKTGRLLKRFCRGSVNIELESREHCWVESDDIDESTGQTFLQWYESVTK